MIYRSIIRPVFLNYESEIDQVATTFREQADQAATKLITNTLKPILAKNGT